MDAFSQPMNWPALESVIDFSPIVILPETLLVDAIALMDQAHRHSDSLAHPEHANAPQGSSCVLLVDKSRLIGIITGKDALRFAAARLNLPESEVSEAMTQPVITLA